MRAFEEIAKRTPINREALNVALGGTHFSFEPRKLNPTRSDVPPAIITRQLADEEEFTGRVLGRLTVIGRSMDAWEKSKKVRWVVRCACGWYERRRSRALRDMTLDAQMCSNCKMLEERKAGFGPWTNRPKTKRGKGQAPPLLVPVLQPSVPVEKPDYVQHSRRKRLPKTPIPAALRWLVWERDNFTCQHCGSRKHLSVDHVIPESKGGMMVIANLQTLCTPCNSKKGAN